MEYDIGDEVTEVGKAGVYVVADMYLVAKKPWGRRWEYRCLNEGKTAYFQSCQMRRHEPRKSCIWKEARKGAWRDTIYQDGVSDE